MHHGVTLMQNERLATSRIQDNAQKISMKLRTKGRFHVEIATNGLLNRNDNAWAQLANPEAHAAHIHREQLDIKILQKKKQSRELSASLWTKKHARAS